MARKIGLGIVCQSATKAEKTARVQCPHCEKGFASAAKLEAHIAKAHAAAHAAQ